MKSRTLRIIIATIALLVGYSVDAEAQYKFSFQDSLGSYKVEFTPHKSNTSEATLMRKPVSIGAHELRLGTAFCSATPDGYTTDNWWALHITNNPPQGYNVQPERWFTLGFEVGKWYKEWLYFGGTAVWTGGFAQVIRPSTRERVDTYNYNCLSLTPTLRFAWVRRGIVQLYSGLGLGLAMVSKEDLHSDTLELNISYDVTFIGLSVGRNLFGYIDLGAGYRGVVSAGIGYRFNK